MATLETLLKKAQSFNENEEYQKVIDLLTLAILKTHNSADIYAEKAQALWRLKKYKLCNEAAGNALSFDPKHAKGNHYKGNFYYNNKEYDKAIEHYNNAIETDPKFAHPYNSLGNTYRALKEYDKAIEYYNKAIEVDPKYASAFYNLGITYNDLKEHNKANEFFNKAIKVDPKNASAYYNLGITYRDLKENKKAVEAYKKTVKIDPKHANAYYNLGNTYRDLKENEKAVDAYNKAIKVDPKNASAYYNLGITYRDLKENEKAVEAYKKTVKINPKHANAYFNLGNNYEDIKEYDKSLSAYKKYEELTKDDPDYFTSIVKSRIEELKKLIKNEDLSSIRELINKIKDLLLYKEGCITHYTSLSVAKALILNGSLFRLSEGAFLNDTSEGRELFKFLSFHFSSKKGSDTIAELFTQKPFIGSFVAEIKHDDLTLWRMYGKEEKEEAKGCTVTIEMKELLENLKDKMLPKEKTGSSSKNDEEFSFYRVAYRQKGESDSFIIPGTDKEQEKEKELNECMNKLSLKVKAFKKRRTKASDKQNILELLNEIAYLFKSVEYQHEHEVRLVIKGIGFKKNIQPDPELGAPRVYIELVTVRPLIRKITLGPKVERADEWAAAFYYSLSKDDYHPEILISHLPFK